MPHRVKLARAIERFGRPTVAVIGDLMLDRYLWGNVERISPEAPIPVLAVTREDVQIGNAGCVLSNLATFGASCRAVGVLGDDEPGKRFRAMLADLDILDDLILSDAGRPTSLKTRLVARTQQLMRVDEEMTAPLSDATQAKLAESAARAVAQSDIVLVSDCGKGVICPTVMSAVVQAARERGVKVLVDPSRDHDYAMYRGATLITPNRAEARRATGVPVDHLGDFEIAARLLISKIDLDAVVITLDQDGIYCAVKDGPGKQIPTRRRAVFDVTGAGDMVLSVLGMALASGADVRTSAELANLAAGIEIEKLGAATVSLDELSRAARGHEHLASAKIVSVDDLESRLAEHRRRQDRIVFTNGCFDLLHVGHVDYLGSARKHGDVMIVGLNSDASVRRIKGPERPYQAEAERARILAALHDVDYVVLFDEDTPEALIRRVRPDTLIKGEDWRDKGVVGQEFVESYGGAVVLCQLVEGVSSTRIADRIRNGGGAVGASTSREKAL